MKKIFCAAAAIFLAAQVPALAAFRFGTGNAAAQRAAQVMEDAVPANPVMSLPISPLESLTTGQVIWPFGVQGGGHPNGHPGIDFETINGGSLYASATARVTKIEYDFTDGQLHKLVMFETSSYQIVYVGSLVNIGVNVGDVVVKGQKFAELNAFSPTSPYGFVHWGVNSKSQQTAICPYNLLSPEAQAQLDQLFRLTSYSEQNRYPQICNPCPAGGCR